MKPLKWLFPDATKFVYEKAIEFVTTKVKLWLYNHKWTIFRYTVCILIIIIISVASLLSKTLRYFVKICIFAYCVLHYNDIINCFMNVMEDINNKILLPLTLFVKNKMIMNSFSYYKMMQRTLFGNIESFQSFNSTLPIWYHWNLCMLAIFPLFILLRYSTTNIFFILLTSLIFILLRMISFDRIYRFFMGFKEIFFEFLDFIGEEMLKIGKTLNINKSILENLAFVDILLEKIRGWKDKRDNQNKNDKENKNESEKESETKNENRNNHKNDKENKNESEKENRTQNESQSKNNNYKENRTINEKDRQDKNEDEFTIIQHIWHHKFKFTLILIFFITFRNFLITYMLCVMISLVLLGFYVLYNIVVSKLTNTEFNYKFMWRMYFINRLVLIKPIWMQFFSYDEMYVGSFFNYEEYTFLQFVFIISYYIRFISYMYIFLKSIYETTSQKIHSQQILIMLFIPF